MPRLAISGEVLIFLRVVGPSDSFLVVSGPRERVLVVVESCLWWTSGD